MVYWSNMIVHHTILTVLLSIFLGVLRCAQHRNPGRVDTEYVARSTGLRGFQWSLKESV